MQGNRFIQIAWKKLATIIVDAVLANIYGGDKYFSSRNTTVAKRWVAKFSSSRNNKTNSFVYMENNKHYVK